MRCRCLLIKDTQRLSVAIPAHRSCLIWVPRLTRHDHRANNVWLALVHSSRLEAPALEHQRSGHHTASAPPPSAIRHPPSGGADEAVAARATVISPANVALGSPFRAPSTNRLQQLPQLGADRASCKHPHPSSRQANPSTSIWIRRILRLRLLHPRAQGRRAQCMLDLSPGS